MSAAPEASVIICSVGALSNLAELWRHAPDLVRKKVRLLVVMGGQFPKSERPETNIDTHREAAQLIAAEWPGEIVWHGWEVGNGLFTGEALKPVPAKNPVRRAYELKPFGKRPAIEGGQPSWDQGTALFAVRGPQPELWDLVSGTAGCAWMIVAIQHGIRRQMAGIATSRSKANRKNWHQ